MVTWGSTRQAIGVTGRDVVRIKNAQTLHQLRPTRLDLVLQGVGKIAEQPAQSMPPGLLALGKVQPLSAFSTA